VTIHPRNGSARFQRALFGILAGQPLRAAIPEDQQASRSASSRNCAFTLIELMVVIAVILILAGLVLSISGYAMDKGKRSRAETEIAAMSAAMESYKADNGIYPSTANTVSLTSAQPDPTSTAYKNASLDLYKALSGDLDANGSTDANQKSYFTFKPQMLFGPRDSNGNLTSVAYIRDPFGRGDNPNSYGYSTSKNPMANPNYATAAGNNPTFDLWSTAGGTTVADVVKWVKNW
jgi:prepilin-type N-terminal cleavage/methylation domain-containing protein